MTRLKVIFLVLAIFLIAFFVFTNFEEPSSSKGTRFLSIGSAKIEVDIVDTEAKRTQGLSGRESLGSDMGMLFVFAEPGLHSFWMRDMNFAIDIIWIGEDYKIVGIERNATPESFPASFTPPSPAQFVLEVNAGWADDNNVSVGDGVSF